MVAGHGWDNDVVGSTVWAETDSMAAYVLQSAEPVIVKDARTITAFRVPEMVRAHGVISGISVVIPGAARPWGILEAQSRRARVFVEDDFHFLQSVANVISSAHARRQNETEREHLAAFVQHNPNPVMETLANTEICSRETCTGVFSTIHWTPSVQGGVVSDPM